MGGEVKDECGIAAVFLKKDCKVQNVVPVLYRLLINMQNRGQLSAGMTTFNQDRRQIIDTYKDLGPVAEVFKLNNRLKKGALFFRYKGSKGIGHTRYATCGADNKNLAQPFERHHGRKWKWFSFCFNGNLANYTELKQQLMKKKVDYHIIHDNDTEIIMHYLSREFKGSKEPKMTKVFSNLSKIFDGAYNIAYMNAKGDMAIIRDPLGIRPLCYGETDGMFLVASESNALINCGVEDFRSLDPGEMIHIKNGKVQIKRYAPSKRKAHCMFEWVYFANVSSKLNNVSVYQVRTRLGKKLAELEPLKIDDDFVVVPVPDTSKPMGDSMAFHLKVPVKEGLIRNRYVGRTFIEGQSREDRIRDKFTVMREILKGKKVLLVDDSIVRGLTCKKLISYLKEVGGAKEVHLRVSCPAIIAPCFYGIDMSTVSELMVPHYLKDICKDKVDEKMCAKIAKKIGADSLVYMTKQGLLEALGLPKEDLCMACLDCKYPTQWGKKLFRKALNDFKKKKVPKKRTYE